jgi:hypothetical protein
VSHITKIDTEIKDLNALAQACEELGLELVLGKKDYRWFGRFIGDSPLPQGFRKDELGKCEHAIRVKNAKGDTYEVGVVKRRDGRNGYTLLYDYWAGGNGLIDKIGNGAKTLTREYTLQAAMKKCRQKGMTVVRSIAANGKPQMIAKQRV